MGKEWTKLEPELKRQGFDIKSTASGVAVLAPDGATHMFHPSSLEKQPAPVYRDLHKIGFKDPRVAKRERKVARTRERGIYICSDPICGCGREFPFPQNLGRHLAAVREKQAKALVEETMPIQKPETTKPTPPDEIRRARHLIKSLRNLSEDSLDMADLLEHVLQENIDLKRKLAKVEELLGKTIDQF